MQFVCLGCRVNVITLVTVYFSVVFIFRGFFHSFFSFLSHALLVPSEYTADRVGGLAKYYVNLPDRIKDALIS